MKRLFEYLKYIDEYHKNHLLSPKETRRLTLSILHGVDLLEAIHMIPSIPIRLKTEDILFNHLASVFPLQSFNNDLIPLIKHEKLHDWIVLALLNSLTDGNGVKPFHTIPEQHDGRGRSNKEFVEEQHAVNLNRFKLALKLLDRINNEPYGVGTFGLRLFWSLSVLVFEENFKKCVLFGIR